MPWWDDYYVMFIVNDLIFSALTPAWSISVNMLSLLFLHTVLFINPCISVERMHDVTNGRVMLLWQDGKITEDEWVGMWEKFALERETSGRLPDWHHNYIDFLFGVSDTSGNRHNHTRTAFIVIIGD